MVSGGDSKAGSFNSRVGEVRESFCPDSVGAEGKEQSALEGSESSESIDMSSEDERGMMDVF